MPSVLRASRRVLQLTLPIVPIGVLVRLEMLMALGYWPDLKHPASFNEKLQQWMLGEPRPLSTVCADKWAVRQYVLSKTNRPDILNEVYFVGTNPSEIPFDELPRKFVIKATHGSGWNVLVTDKAAADIGRIVSLCRKWLSMKFSVVANSFSERHYDAIVPRVIVEKFIEDGTLGMPLDYKFFCFNGKPAYVQVDVDRFGNHRRNFYDLAWREVDFRLVYDKGQPVPRPPMLNDMIDLAAKVSADFSFCRVDFYNPDGKQVLFGEVTLAPQSGLGRFYPRQWDYRLGALWNESAGRTPQ